jgi:uncharacterized protein YrrD
VGCRLEDAAESDMARTPENELATRMYRRRKQERENAYCQYTGIFGVGAQGTTIGDVSDVYFLNATNAINGCVAWTT